MSSLLKSSFDLDSKRALLIVADKAIAYECHSSKISRAYQFAADEEGREAFARYLAQSHQTPFYVLVDIVEEEYRQDVIPHVRGADRRAVLERKFARLFRGTAYCSALTQGRETEGRKDDKVLLTAITKPEIVAPWLEIIVAAKAPIAGVYSLPVLSQRLLKKIGAKGTNILLITVQSASGLRQTFFRDRQIKISRLAQMPRIGSVPYASHIMGELEKLRRYLNSLALISSEGPVEIYILSHGEWLNELEQHCRNTESERYYLIDVADVAARLNISREINTAYSDILFSQLLLDEGPKNSYASEDETTYFRQHRMRNGLLAASVLLLFGSIVWSGLNFVDGISFKQQALDSQQKANFYEARYVMARQDLPPTAVEPRDIKRAVDIADTLKHYKSDPARLFAVISHGLEASPQLHLDRIKWYFAVDPNSNGETGIRRGRRAEGVEIEADAQYSHYHIAIFNARFLGFDGDYRAAIQQADDLKDTLMKMPGVHHAEILSYPLDVKPDANLIGTATEPALKAEARVAVKVVLGISDGREQS